MLRVMEYGTSNQAAKPVIRPAIEDVKPETAKLSKSGGTKAVAEAIVERIKVRLAVFGQDKLGDKLKIREVK